ncbi:hypothetical protein F4782DRAFT_102277 [Xylaria castorea]|nr:hypothetical protein F4782DRAFT_102277 [Xylaria castorea]
MGTGPVRNSRNHPLLVLATSIIFLLLVRDVYMGANLDIPTPASLKSGNSLPASDELVAISSAYEKDHEKSFTTTKGSPQFYTENGNNTVYSMPGSLVWEG